MEKGGINLGVLGLGHVGLPTALGLAELGWTVLGADDDKVKARRLAAGEVPFFEPGLAEMLQKHLDSSRFKVMPDVPTTVRQSTVLFVCVGTPQQPDGAADLGQVERVAQTIARHLNGYKLIVEKSTAPVMTAQWIRRTIER